MRNPGHESREADELLIRELRALPVRASPARTWSAITRAIAADRRRAEAPWFLEAATLAAAALVLATMLVRHSEPLAERLGSWSLLAGRAAIPDSLEPWLLPLLFVLTGAMGAAAALPLLWPRGRAVTPTHP